MTHRASCWHGATTVVMTSDRDAFGLIDASTRVLRIIDGGVGQVNAEATDALIQIDVNGGGDSWTTLYQIVDASAATMMSNPDFFLFQ